MRSLRETFSPKSHRPPLFAARRMTLSQLWTAPEASKLARLSAPEARALALRAQGFGTDRLLEPIHVLNHLGYIQLDSVNVLARSHDLVPFARLGPSSTTTMHDAIYRQRRGFEYWGHEASWLPIEEFRSFLPRMAYLRQRWSDERAANPHLYDEILARIRAEGPLGSASFEDPRSTRGTWWDSRKPAKIVLERLFASGELMCTSRTNGFARLYDLPERVLPPNTDTSDPGTEAAARHLLRRAIDALGIATATEAADYFRLKPFEWRPALQSLVEEGHVVVVAVEGWQSPGLVTPECANHSLDVPTHRPTFLSPFDNLVWERERVERVFGFRYRIEIYVPEPKRQYGYYVLPLLAQGQLAGRADLKLDRSNGTLRVQCLWLEGATPDDAASALRDLATHLGVQTIAVERAVPDATLATMRRLVS